MISGWMIVCPELKLSSHMGKPVLENFINNWNNPSVGGGERIPVVGRFFFGAGAVHHVDCRYYRDRKETMLGLIKNNGKDTLQLEATLKSLLHPFFPVLSRKQRSMDGCRKNGRRFSVLLKRKIEGVFLIGGSAPD